MHLAKRGQKSATDEWSCIKCRVGQNRICTTYTVYDHMYICMVHSLPKIPYIHRIYVQFWPTLAKCFQAVLRSHDSIIQACFSGCFARTHTQELLLHLTQTQACANTV